MTYSAEKQLGREAQRGAGTANGYDQNAGQTRGRFMDMIGGFNPQQYANQAAGAMYSGLSEQFRTDGARHNASLSSRGLFGSDLGGTAMRKDQNERVARGVASLSMQAAGMEQNRIGMMGDQANRDANMAYENRGRYHDLLSGQADRATAKRNARKSRWASLAGGIGALGGFALGGPGGAAVGGAIGKGVGNFFG